MLEEKVAKVTFLKIDPKFGNFLCYFYVKFYYQDLSKIAFNSRFVVHNVLPTIH